MSKINSKDKGARGELELSHFLKGYGIEARRSAQYSGLGGEGPDIVSDWNWVHIEVKRTEKLKLREAYEQAIRDSKGTGKVPIVVHRSNRQPWMVTMSLDDLLTSFMVQKKNVDDPQHTD